jgi:dimethylaniline monooxygenase (N-oxide forming) / hypotaurine monooxygenase
MNPAPRRVAVVGAGPSGLTTVKALLEEGHQPTCFEQASSLGGVFRLGEDDGVVWESCRLTSSALLTAFSDFPVSSELPEHLEVGQYVQYLERYCAAFGVNRHLRFGATVEAVTPTANGGGWTVSWRDRNGPHSETYDAVAICSGLHQHPKRATFVGQETFPGTMIHGAEYRRPAEVAGRKVLIVGAGESGADIVAEVARHASETVLSLRRGVAVQARRAFDKPGDYRTTRIGNSAAHWIAHTRNPQDQWKRTVYRYACLPVVVIDKLLQLLFRAVWEQWPLVRSRRAPDHDVRIKTLRLTKQLLADSGGTLNEQFGTKSDEFVRAIARGSCRLAPAIARFDGARVAFEDGSSFDPDLVILCTGFETKLPFLESRLADTPRYLNAINPDVGASLGFIGFLRPAFGAIPPLAELQARWFALLLSGANQLPPVEVMRESIERWRRFHCDFFRPLQGRLEHLVEYTPFCDALAAEIGCKPTAAALRQEGLAFQYRFFAGPFVAAQYRLVGPHAKPEIAREVIRQIPVVHPLPELINHYLRWTASRVLGRALGQEFAPKLVID